MADRAKSGSGGSGGPAKRALARLATSLVGYAKSVPRAPRSKRDMSAALAPGLDQPGAASNNEAGSKPVVKAQGGDQASETFDLPVSVALAFIGLPLSV